MCFHSYVYLHGVPSVGVIDLRDNALEAITADAFVDINCTQFPDSFSWTVSVLLQHNAIASIADGAFAGLYMTQLNLSHNALTALSSAALANITGPTNSAYWR